MDEIELGAVRWHCSDEDSGPDVGKSFKLPNGGELYFGELSDRTLADRGVNPDGVGWVIAHFGADGGLESILGQCFDTIFENDGIEVLALGMKPATAIERGEHEEKKDGR